MSELDCRAVRQWMDENVGGATSWVDFSSRLDGDRQEHFSACPECREVCLQLLELERQLLTLREEPLPELDLTAGVLARIGRPAVVGPAVPQGFSLWAWAPLALLLVLLLPEPAGLPGWLGWSWAWPQIPVWGLKLPVDPLLVLLAGLPLAVLASWKGRAPHHA